MANYLTARGVQPFVITIASGNTTGTATINSVGAGAFIMFDGINPSVAANPAEDFARVILTNSTTVTATRNTGTAGTIVITGCVIDGDPGNLVKSVQFGTITLTGVSSNTATISPVTNANTAYHLLGWSSTNTTYSGINENPTLSLSGTTLTATRAGTTGNITVGYVVVEFQAAALAQSVQNVSATSSSSVTSFTAAISAVTVANTMMFYAGSRIATSTTNLANIKMRGSLTSTTQVTVNVNTGVANAKTYNCCVVSFVSGVLNSAVQRNSTTLTGVTSNSTSLGTQVNNASTALSFLGNSTTVTTAQLGEAEGNAELSTVSVGGVSLTQSDANYSTPSGGPSRVRSLNNSSSSGTVTVGSFSGFVSGGELIVVYINFFGSSAGTVSSVTDNLGQTYTHVTAADASNTGGTGSKTQIWYTQNTGSGFTTITVTYTGTTSCFAAGEVISGMPTSGTAVDATATISNGTSSASPQTAALTTTNASDFIAIAFAGPSQSNVNSVSAPYNQDGGIGNVFGAWQTTTATVSAQKATFSQTAQTYCASTVAFKGNTPAYSSSLSVNTSNTTAGNLIAVCITLPASGTYSSSISSVTDSASQTYTHASAADASFTASGGGSSFIYYCQNTAANVNTVTVTLNTGAPCVIDVYEIANVPTTGGIVDVTATVNNGSTTTTPVTGSLTTTNANDFIITAICTTATAFPFFNTVNAPYTAPGNTSAYYIPGTTVTSNTSTYNISPTSPFCASTIAFIGNTPTLNDIVLVQKATATGNITASWEVIEFVAFNPGAMSSSAFIMTSARGSAGGRASLSAQAAIKSSMLATLTGGVAGVALQALNAIKVMASASFSGKVPLQAQNKIQLSARGNLLQLFFLSALGSIKTAARGTLINFNFLSGRSAVQIKLASQPTLKASLKSLATAMIKARGGVSTVLSLAISGLSAIQVKGKSGISANASLQGKNAIQIKGIGTAISASFMHAIGKIALKLQASISGSASVSGKTPVMVKSTLSLVGKTNLSGNVLTLVQGRAQPSGSVSLTGKTPIKVKARGIDIFAKFLSSVSSIAVRMRGIMRTKAAAPVVCCRPIEVPIPAVTPSESNTGISAFYEKPSTVNTNPIETGGNDCGC